MTEKDVINHQPFQITELALTNFKCFEEQSFHFPGQFTVLVGDNGAGKTAILEALNVGVGAFFQGIDGHKVPPIDSDYARIVQHEMGQALTLESQYPVSVRCTGVWQGRKVEWTRVHDGEGEIHPFQFPLQFPTYFPKQRTETPTLASIAQNLQKQVRQGAPVTLPVIAYYSTGRLWRSVGKGSLDDIEEPGSRFKGYDNCLNPASHTDTMKRWFKTQELIALQEQETNTALEAVKNAITNCIQDLEHVFYNIRQGDLLATFTDERTLPFGLLSEGFRNMLAMVVDIAQRAAILNPQLEADVAEKTPGIVLIDEIDLHLHPRWQRRVVEDLRRAFPRIQFIATTHSPFIIQSLRPGELIDLNQDPTGEYVNKSIEDITEDVMGIPIPQRSERYNQMFAAAQEYYRVLEQAEGANPEEINRLKQKLDELVEPFSDNVAYHAFLQMERLAAGLDGDNDNEAN